MQQLTFKSFWAFPSLMGSWVLFSSVFFFVFNETLIASFWQTTLSMFSAPAASQLAGHACSSCVPSHVKAMIKVVLKIEGLHGRRHALVLLARSPILTTSTHTPRRKPNFWLNLRFNILECGGNAQGGKASAPASHLKKSLTIKSRREDSEWLQSRTEAAMAAEIVMRSPVQLSALLSHSLWVAKTWHGILMTRRTALLSESLHGNIQPNMDFTYHTPVSFRDKI